MSQPDLRGLQAEVRRVHLRRVVGLGCVLLLGQGVTLVDSHVVRLLRTDKSVI